MKTQLHAMKVFPRLMLFCLIVDGLWSQPTNMTQRIRNIQTPSNDLIRAGKFDSAQKVLHAEIALGMKSSDSLSLAKSLSSLSEVLLRTGRYREALDTAQKALTIIKAAVGEEDTLAARAYDDIGMANYYLGQNQMAIDNYNKALTIRVRQLGPNHPDVAASYNNIGLAHYRAGNFTRAAENFNLCRQNVSPEKLQEGLLELTTGRILFNSPDTMKVGVKERVEVRIAGNISTDLTIGLRGTGIPHIEELAVSAVMNVHLAGDNFDIRSLSQEEQLVEGEDFTQWEWDVTPSESGVQVLLLSVAAKIIIPNFGEKPLSYPVFEKQITVAVNPSYSIGEFLDKYWLPLITTLFGSGSLLALLRFIKRKWKEERR